MECNHCQEMISSRIIDEHEAECSRKQKGKGDLLQRNPTTIMKKHKSTDVELRHDESTDRADFTSLERTPVRNNVVYDHQRVFSEHKPQNMSPFAQVRSLAHGGTARTGLGRAQNNMIAAQMARGQERRMKNLARN